MVESPSISNAPLSHPGMDYARLREEGIKAIAALAGNKWTDYNAHDPGITILEALCYAITDLSYRLDFEMADLLAYPAEQSDGLPQFLTAREILTVNPLTIEDYRKVLIDIDGVKNAWLEIVDIPQPELYYDAEKASLSFSSVNLAEPVNLRGLYRVLIEPDRAYWDEEPDRDYRDKELKLIEAATERLQQQRNLCEDFAEIRVLPIEEITVRAEIEIGDRLDPNQLMAELYTALEREISPALEFLNLSELIDRGVPVEDIFVGPKLEHGFIDDKQLEKFQRRDELHTSDLIHIILDLAGVKTVRNITLSSDRSPQPEAWALDLDLQLTPSLKSIEEAIQSGDIKFYKGQISCSLDLAKIQKIQEAAKIALSSKSNSSPPQDIPVPRGNYRELADYVSIQNEFPLTYGIGDFGLPASASVARKAQAKQLQAYLTVFDQLLANHFAQLDRVRELFSLSNRQIQTYFTQSIKHFPGAENILKESYATYLDRSSVEAESALNRKNRLLDRLLAQYGEAFTDRSLLYPDSDSSKAIAYEKNVNCKVDFAQDYRQISSGRDRAFNYTLDPDRTDDFHNVSGLKRRIARLLGIEPDRQFFATANDVEGFYLIEHILLRPRQEDVRDPDSNAESSPNFLSFSQPIDEFQESERSGYVTCTSENHGLKEGDRVKIFYSINYNGTYDVTNLSSNTFDISHDFISGEVPDSGAWVLGDRYPDPFSFQLSAIFPDWSGRFKDPNFRQLVRDTLIAETPAHISLYVHWFDRAKMQDFETTYAIWLQQLSGRKINTTLSENCVNRLISLLELGSNKIQQPSALLGYMTIVGDENNSVENPFQIL